MPLATINANGILPHNPMALCQLKSRAFPESPPRNHTIGRRHRQFIFFGHHKNGPEITMNRNSTLAAAYTGSVFFCVAELVATHRCQFLSEMKNSCARFAGCPLTAPVYGFR